MTPPVVILVRPQLAENIGMCARAMMNFGLVEMRLVAPRDGWPKKGARQASSGAASVLDNAKLFETTRDAVADLHYVLATTARERGQMKPVFAADEAAAKVQDLAQGGSRAGILFGPERMGLSNDDVALADAIVSFPVSPAFTSINLAQAVLLVGYEWWKLVSGGKAPIAPTRSSPPATREHMLAFFDYVEKELDAVSFFYPPEKRDIMMRNFRNIWHRLEMTEQDVQTMRGAVASLVGGRQGTRTRRD
ncbi:RNA methyltransferase [Labrys monachus]|uniref:tRNA/rRNA methyltransferase n=1 Tax=Labrys monachus TaxID=217067 RepID=A0ABU0FHJ1_9HYPH|nr:RNA methyltransferase [Labrys monachus]MDQ0394040.1 tRNA/rRNA methyltransferase [Labrys monachus]